MCRRATCRNCQRPTYKGCGNHVEQVLGDVAPAERCRCAEEARRQPVGPTAASTATGGWRSWFSRG